MEESRTEGFLKTPQRCRSSLRSGEGALRAVVSPSDSGEVLCSRLVGRLPDLVAVVAPAGVARHRGGSDPDFTGRDDWNFRIEDVLGRSVLGLDRYACHGYRDASQIDSYIT